jgi:hypothetical protein
MSARPPALFAVLLLLGTLTARAQTTFDDFLTLSGFGTLAVTHSSYTQGDFVATIEEPVGVGYSHSWSAAPDSDLGVQANLRFSDALSGVVQVLSRDDEYGNFRPSLEWANLKYDFTTDLSLRLGRILLPTYEVSDIRNVGYSLPWIRVPTEITYASNASYSDGLDLLYRFRSGELTQDFELQLGLTNQDLPGEAYTSDRSRLALLSDTLRCGDLSLHLAYQQSDPINLPMIRLHLLAAGAIYDPGPWFVSVDSNYTHDRYFGDLFAGYVSAGMRFGRFAPYLLVSALHAVEAGTSQLRALGNQHTLGAGVRWDFARNTDLKAQLAHATLVSLDDPVSFTNLQPGAHPGDSAAVVSVALDFVF